MDAAVAAVSRFTLIGAALLAAYLGFREWTKAREEEERRQAYAAGCAASPQPQRQRQRLPPQPADHCPVCLDSYYSPIEILPCGHVFHKKCIRSWFDQRLICPVCKGTLSAEDREEYRRRLRD